MNFSSTCIHLEQPVVNIRSRLEIKRSLEQRRHQTTQRFNSYNYCPILQYFIDFHGFHGFHGAWTYADSTMAKCG